MARPPKQIDRTIEFWDRHLGQPYLIDAKSLSVLETAIHPLRGQTIFTLEHMQALVLSVSLCESQIRDCIRLAIDSPFIEIDAENPIIKDVKFDFRLLNSVRDRHLTLGGFFALNTSVSTVSRFWSGAELSFKGYDFATSFSQWDYAQTNHPTVSLDDLKDSLAWVFAERNRYVHEFSELVAGTIGAVYDNGRFTSALERVFLLLEFFQQLKTKQYGGSYNEEAPSRGHVGKELNTLNRKIASEIEELDALLRSFDSLSPRPGYGLHDPQDIRKAIFALRATHAEYLFRLGGFIYYAMGPGTIVQDFIYGAHLDELRQLDDRLARALKHQEGMAVLYADKSG